MAEAKLGRKQLRSLAAWASVRAMDEKEDRRKRAQRNEQYAGPGVYQIKKMTSPSGMAERGWRVQVVVPNRDGLDGQVSFIPRYLIVESSDYSKMDDALASLEKIRAECKTWKVHPLIDADAY